MSEGANLAGTRSAPTLDPFPVLWATIALYA
jgi:hypothetical protein